MWKMSNEELLFDKIAHWQYKDKLFISPRVCVPGFIEEAETGHVLYVKNGYSCLLIGPNQILSIFHHLTSFDGPKSRFSPFKVSCLLIWSIKSFQRNWSKLEKNHKITKSNFDWLFQHELLATLNSAENKKVLSEKLGVGPPFDYRDNRVFLICSNRIRN